MSHRVTLIPGDGVGPELVDAARIAVEATGVPIEWDLQRAGLSVAEAAGTALPAEVLESIRGNGVALKGPLGTPAGFRSVNVALRVALDLYASVRPCRWYPGVRSRYEGVDVVIVRESTEGSYTGIELEQGAPETAELIGFIERTTGTRVREDSGLSIKSISRGASERIARFAFALAKEHGRRKVTAGHKANIMKFSDGVFLETTRRVALEYPEVPFEDRIIDNLTMQLVQRPADYDVLVLPNLYGDILSDLCAGLVGGLGVAPGAIHGESCAVFEATHGTAPRYRGLGRANPMALMLSGAMMLRHLGETEAGDRLETAVADVIAEGRDVTYDLKPTRDDPAAASTARVRDAVVA
ncbi:MAG TPA: isocitrate/isopropylmalate family dehydrogenase, partial [Gemmatimonadota bacterium]|nr:isocitrate/isopropylmalate family dehydrogenase [Gemmatimonadota bacterium]